MKKYLKSILCLILALALVFAVAACGDDESADDEEDEEEAKEKDKDEKDDDEDDEDDKDDDKKSSSKERELIGKTKNEKAAEEAFYEWFDDDYRSMESEIISEIYARISNYDIPQECVDEHLDYCVDFVEDYFDAAFYSVNSVEEIDSSTVEIEYYHSNLGADKLEDDRYINNLLDLLYDREEYDDDEFIEEFNEIMEDIKDHREDILKYPSEADAFSESMTMYKEDGKWMTEYERCELPGHCNWCGVSDENLNHHEDFGELCDDCYDTIHYYCSDCGKEIDEFYQYDGLNICEDCLKCGNCGEKVDTPYEGSFGEPLCESCYDFYCCDNCGVVVGAIISYNDWYICEDCYNSFTGEYATDTVAE